MGDSVGVDTKIVICETLLVALIIFPQQRQFLCQSQLTQAVTAHPADVDYIARPIAQFALGHRPVEIRVELLVGGWILHGLVPSWCPSGKLSGSHQASRTLGNGSDGVRKSSLTVLLFLPARSDRRQSLL